MEVDLFGMKYPITDEEELRELIEKILADDYEEDFGDCAIVCEPIKE